MSNNLSWNHFLYQEEIIFQFLKKLREKHIGAEGVTELV
jgi:hypothetical protein